MPTGLLGVDGDGNCRQQREWKTKEPLYWENGKPSTNDTGEPVMQPVFTLFVEGLVSATDDGLRMLYCGSRNIRDAIRDAILAKGADGMEMGATLTVQYVGGSGNTGDPERYEATYERPTVPVGNNTPQDATPPADRPATGSILGAS